MAKNPFAQVVKNHWKANFPKQAKELEEAGMLDQAAEEAADRAGRVHEQGTQQGMSWTQAEELATEEWGTPPNAS